LREDRILVSSVQCMSRARHVGIIVGGVFAIISGLTEVVVGLTGHTFRILSKDPDYVRRLKARLLCVKNQLKNMCGHDGSEGMDDW